MAVRADVPAVAMQVSRGVLVASIQLDLDDAVLARFREDLLARIQETGSQAVILDVSGLEMLDTAEFTALRRIMEMARLMGSKSLLVGLQPGVVSALIGAGADVDGLEAAIDLDAAFARFEPEPSAEGEPAAEEEPDAEAEDAEDPHPEPQR